MKISNKVYDVMKWVTMIVLPALGSLYFGLSEIWGFPYGEQVVGSISCITVFLGAILGLSNKSYYKDDIADEDMLCDTEAE